MAPMDTTSNTAKVIAEVERLTKVANEKFPGHVFIVPTVRFRSLGRAAGRAIFPNTIEFNIDLVEAAPERVLADTVPHELAHLIHYTFRPWDFRKGSRLGHGRYWQMIARTLGLTNPTRCMQADDTIREAIGMRKPTLHVYKCPLCGNTAKAGPRQHAKLQRGLARFKIITCGHAFGGLDYVGVAA